MARKIKEERGPIAETVSALLNLVLKDRELYELFMVPARDEFKIRLFDLDNVRHRICDDVERIKCGGCSDEYLSRYLNAFIASYSRFPESWKHYGKRYIGGCDVERLYNRSCHLINE